MRQISPESIDWLIGYMRRYGDNVNTAEGELLRSKLMAEYEAWRQFQEACNGDH